MSNEIVLFSSEERTDVQHVSEFLRQLADKISAQEVILQKGSERLVLQLPRSVVLEVKVEEEAKRSGPQRSLEIEIEWMEGQQDDGPLTLG